MRSNSIDRRIMLLILLGLGVLLILLNVLLNNNSAGGLVWLGPRSISSQESVNPRKVSNKWIVVTSINHPTEDVKRLAETGWNLVVVADKKTPSDWYLKDLKLPRLLPFGTYTRKNVGYLYAIMKGAEWIYDTDDDNKPYGLGLDQFDYEETVSGLRYQQNWTSDMKQNMFNPYSYFGNRKMWPRGFPLEMISDHSNGVDRTISCREMKPASVQQGLVHQDPDVDAIYRLLNANEKTGLNVGFDRFAPPITLESGVYSPWNSQNTLFNRKAFFTMFLPSSVAFRVTDIWRSYFSQKLLQIVNETVAFYPVNALQVRNAHNYLKDFEDESDVYIKSGAIVKTLNQWKCLENTTEKCVVSLAKRFSRLGYWNNTDVQLIRDWVDDLKSIGYEFPLLIHPTFQSVYYADTDRNPNCIRVYMDFSQSMYLKSDKKKHQNTEDMLGFCNKNANTSFNHPMKSAAENIDTSHDSINQKNKTALIITSNNPWKSGIGVLQRLYEPYFAVTIFCGSWNETSYKESNETFPTPRIPFNYIHVNLYQTWAGTANYYCLSKARDLKLENIEGYYMLSDDSVFNLWQNVDQTQIVSPLGWTPNDTAQWESEYAKPRTTMMIDTIKSGKYANDSRVQSIWKKYDELCWKMMKQSGVETLTNFTDSVHANMFYVPSSHMDFFADLFELMNDVALIPDVAVAKVFHLFDIKVYPNQTKHFTWEERQIYDQVYNSSMIMVHPIELGLVSENEGTLRKYCNAVVKTFTDMM